MPKKELFSKSLKNEDTIAKNVQIIHDIKIRELYPSKWET
jgi:hypothetical protein